MRPNQRGGHTKMPNKNSGELKELYKSLDTVRDAKAQTLRWVVHTQLEPDDRCSRREN